MSWGVVELQLRTNLPPSEVARRLTGAILPSRVFIELPFMRKPHGSFAGYVDGNRIRLRGPSPDFSGNLHALIEGAIHPTENGSELQLVCRPAISLGFHLAYCALFLLGAVLIMPQAGVLIGLLCAAFSMGIARLLYLLASRHAEAEAQRAEHFLTKLLSARRAS